MKYYMYGQTQTKSPTILTKKQKKFLNILHVTWKWKKYFNIEKYTSWLYNVTDFLTFTQERLQW